MKQHKRATVSYRAYESKSESESILVHQDNKKWSMSKYKYKSKYKFEFESRSKSKSMPVSEFIAKCQQLDHMNVNTQTC